MTGSWFRRIAVLLSSWILTVCWSPVAAAAPGDHEFSLGFPVFGPATVDAGGAVTAAGTFTGTVDFGGGPLVFMGMFTPDVFVAHFDASGNHLWSFSLTHNNGFGGATIEDVEADASGNVYLGGRIFDGDIDFGGGMLTGPNMFVVKLDSTGAHVWSATYGNGTLNAIDVSSAGIAIGAHTSSSVDFGGGTITSAGAADAVVAVLDSSGGHVWSAGYGDAGSNQAVAAIAIDAAGNVTAAGGTQGTVDFGGGPLMATTADLFLARFGPTGSHVFSQVIAGSYSGGSSVFSVDPKLDVGTNVVIAGEMRGSIDFGGGSLASNGQADIYVAVYDPATGAHQWSAHWGASTSEFVTSLSVDANDNLIVTGTMFGAFDAGGGTLPFVGGTDIFLAVFDETGLHLLSDAFGNGSGPATAVDGSGDILFSGSASSGVDFGGGPLTDTSLVLVKFEGFGGGGPVAVPGLGLLGALALAAALGLGGALAAGRAAKG
jgi:hypothetical protein